MCLFLKLLLCFSIFLHIVFVIGQ
ncbi:hypothetical protein LINPERPRIM_LOCUS41164 [Linum perenne]